MNKSYSPVPLVPCSQRSFLLRGEHRQGGRNHTTSYLNKNKHPPPNGYINIGTINARALTCDSAIDRLVNGVDTCAIDVTCVQETRRREAGSWKWHTGHQVTLGAGSRGGKVGGVGFIIAPHLVAKVTRCEALTERVAVLVLDLDKHMTMMILSVYAPTCAYDDSDVEEFYEQVQQVLHDCQRGAHVIVAGDFNARVGVGDEGEKRVGPYGRPGRNPRGQLLAEFAERTKLNVANTFFKKRLGRRWTWHTPDKKTVHEIDYFLTNCLYLFHNVTVIGDSRFNIGSDHRLVRATMAVLPEVSRRRSAILNQKRSRTVLDRSRLMSTPAAHFSLRRELAVDAKYGKLLSAIRTSVEAASERVQSKPRERLSAETLQMLTTRKSKGLGMTPVERTVLNKAIRMRVNDDYREYGARKAREAAEKSASIKRSYLCTQLKTTIPQALTRTDGSIANCTRTMAKEIEDFFGDLFDSKVQVPSLSPRYDDPPERAEWIVLEEEVRAAISQLKDGKAPGPDHVRAEHLKCLRDVVSKPLAEIFTDVLDLGIVPEQWLESNTILIHKKGPRDVLANFRPICLLSLVLKVFSRVLLNRMQRTLTLNTRREQAGFRSGYSTTDHIHVINQLTERCREYRLPLCLLFIDFKKAFDTVEHQAVLNSLTQFGIPSRYIEVIRQCNSNCTTDINLLHEPVRVKIQRGVRQGEVSSPNLFSAALESLMRTLDLPCGINIDGERLQYLLFADDIVLIADDPSTLEQSLSALSTAANNIGLEIHKGKTQWMKNKFARDSAISLDGAQIELVSSYVYLGQSINMNNDITSEISRRRKAGWAAFNKYREVILDKRLDAQIRSHIFNTHVLPALTYASETWNTTKSEEERLAVTQRAMERAMCRVSLMDRIPAEEIRRRTGVKDIIETIYDAKRRWAGYIARLKDNRWTARVTDWYPRGVKRPAGRPPTRWSDPLTKMFGQRWRTKAKDRKKWRECDLQQWRPQC